MSQDTAGDNKYTSGIAEFVAGLRYEDIPGEVKDRIKLLILDSLGCALYGADLEWSRILMRSLTKLDKTPACGIWGTSLRLSAPHAAQATSDIATYSVLFGQQPPPGQPQQPNPTGLNGAGLLSTAGVFNADTATYIKQADTKWPAIFV